MGMFIFGFGTCAVIWAVTKWIQHRTAALALKDLKNFASDASAEAKKL